MASLSLVSVASRWFCTSIETAFAQPGRGSMGPTEEFRIANRRAQRKLKETPTAASARYDRKSGRIVISLGSGMELRLSPQEVEGLENATPNQLGTIEISPS